MNPVALVLRILAGEKLEKSSRRDTVWWLSGLVAVPLLLLAGLPLAAWLEQSGSAHLLDTLSGIVLLMLATGLATIGSRFLCAHLFRRSPRALVLLALVAWMALAWILWERM